MCKPSRSESRRRRPHCCFATVLSGLLLIGSAWGQEEETDYVSPYGPVNDYLDAIERMEADYGIYASELSDLYLGLGQALVNRGEYEKAREAFHRGVLVVRVNSGPNSPEQTNHLYLLANVETMLGEIKAADKILHNIYFINSEFYGKDSPELLPVLDHMYKWYLMTRPLGTEFAEFSDHEKTNEITKEMARLSAQTRGEYHPETAAAFRRHANVQFLTARYLDNQQPNLYSVVQLSASEFYEAGQRTYRKYLEILKADESTTPLEYAEALADLGDWYLVFEKPAHSRQLYQQGYRILERSGQPAEILRGYMSQPRPLHFVAHPQADQPEDGVEQAEDINLDISMTVTNYGDVRNVVIVKAPEDLTEDEIEWIKRQVATIPFRPAMKEGEVVTTREFIWQYPVAVGGAS